MAAAFRTPTESIGKFFPSVTLFGATLALLDRESIPCALIGAGALAVHGVSRSTYDIDLLATSTRLLEDAVWAPMVEEGVTVDVRRGDASDPLRGVVRLQQTTERDVDVVVGRQRWQQDVLARARPLQILGCEVPVVLKSDLILLKLFAGGHQDLWDIEQLLATVEPDVFDAVDASMFQLPDDCRIQWALLKER